MSHVSLLQGGQSFWRATAPLVQRNLNMTEYHKEVELLYQALAARIGIVIHAAPTETVKQRLYKARTATKDPELDHVQIRSSPTENELWLTNTKPKQEVDLSFLDDLQL